ncbi:Dabb family protein [Clostridium gasigenes]|uniref:Stress responsive A/B Barrel Domain n=1 Tax=Clostridium gasigenes TaxID=94869 RepID=A0A1H0PTT8_9CLOT|nr:Dabb family protein [Clostridium gasigenes]MBU3088218.1 Dabb family protein [Clostridium gasigenes]MBU3104533.1 Dabb family protein [Clostridium gasigenes]MBU3137633.1 Dabb family protein [Clostridium gasigenes]NKF08660.1 Dabb family protein [Clostridium gasigenes]QSW21237.1 Dabb family protein [Clostridium gasigenes]
MIRHIVMWNLNEGFTEEENKINLQKIKNELEKLKDIIEGIISLEVIIDPIAGSNKDLVLNSLFKGTKELENYQTHPEHLRIGKFARNVTCDRVCIDYVE